MKKYFILVLLVVLLMPNKVLAYSPDFSGIRLLESTSRVLLYIGGIVSLYLVLKILKYKKITDLQERKRKTGLLILKLVVTVFIFSGLSIGVYTYSQYLLDNVCTSSFGC